MGIRIDAISRREFDNHYSWHLRAKGLYGQGIYFPCWTGVDGHGLYCDDGQQGPAELSPPDRFHVHDRCTAEQVVHRVVTALVALGWGPETMDDRDAISGGRPFNCSTTKTSAPIDPSMVLG